MDAEGASDKKIQQEDGQKPPETDVKDTQAADEGDSSSEQSTEETKQSDDSAAGSDDQGADDGAGNSDDKSEDDGNSSNDGSADGDDEKSRKEKAAAEYKAREERRKQEEREADEAFKDGLDNWADTATAKEDLSKDERYEGLSDIEKERLAETEARTRRVEAAQYYEKVQNTRRSVSDDYQKAVEKFPVFQDHPDALLDALEDFAPYTNTRTVVMKDGRKATVVTGVKRSLYKHLEKKAKLLEKYAEKHSQSGERKGQQNAQKERILADPAAATGARGGNDSRSDSDLSAAEYAKRYNLKTVRA